MKASVVIPNWNGEKLLPVCLSSLKKQTFKDFEVLIVDNSSSDNSVSLVKKKFPNFKIIQLPENRGFAGGVNAGIKKSKGDYVILINNDTKVDRNCLKHLVKVAGDHPEVGMVAAKMLNFYKKNIVDSAGDYIDSVGHANSIGLGKKDGKKYSSSGYIFLVTGGGCLIKKSVFKKIGFFDEDYFAYFEDVDLCLRAQFVGFKAWYEPKAIIYHIHKATSDKNKKLVEYLQYRNMTITILKDFPWMLIKRDLNWLKIFLVNINTIRFLAIHGYFKEAIKAEFYIFKNLSRLLNKRRKIQSNIKVDMEYIINNVVSKKITFFGLIKNGI